MTETELHEFPLTLMQSVGWIVLLPCVIVTASVLWSMQNEYRNSSDTESWKEDASTLAWVVIAGLVASHMVRP